MDDSQGDAAPVPFLSGHTYTRDETWRFSADGNKVEMTATPWRDITSTLTEAQKLQLETDAIVFGVCFVAETADGYKRVDPRKVIG